MTTIENLKSDCRPGKLGKVYIVIPVHNRINKTLKCLRSIYYQDYKGIHVIVVNDGSSDSTKNDINGEYPQVTILEGDGSLFWTGAIKLGVEYALKICNKEDWILLINNDVQVKSDAIDKLVSFSNSLNRKIIANAVSVDSKDKDTIVKSGTIVKSWFLNRTQHIYHGISLKNLLSYDAVKVNLLTGRCLLHPVEVFDKIGNYNSDLFPHYGGDDEFTARAKLLGYKLYVLPSAIVYLDQDEVSHAKKNIFNALFGIKSSVNIVNKWRFARSVVPFFAFPTYYLIAVLKSIFIFFKK
jgi:GT2 family glycosyltransferase